jgi:hypothetical protein
MRWARERSEDNGKFAKLQREAPLRGADGSVALLISHREVVNLRLRRLFTPDAGHGAAPARKGAP